MKTINSTIIRPIFVSVCAFTFLSADLQAQDAAYSFSSNGSELLTAYGLTQRDDLTLETVEDIKLLVEAMEREYGPYDFRLAETLQSAGDLLDSKGRYSDAAALYERALHITRINNGLYSESHLALVEKLIQCGSELEDWALVDEKYRYLHFLYTRLYENNIPALQRGLAQIAEWHVLAINNGLGGDTLTQLRSAQRVYQQRLELSEGEDSEQQASLQQTLNIIRYQINRVTGTDIMSLYEDRRSSHRATDFGF
ncbi:MAG: tetratricopeptide repeat protein [Pseudohongiellaceae bacterium]|nr:tetratricopeptide repeat protein [Pseudohongiellaceae bacterium]